MRKISVFNHVTVDGYFAGPNSEEEGTNWTNIKLFDEIKAEEIIKLKNQEGEDFTILGSGTIVQQFADLGLIDEYQLVIVPVILGEGKSLFKDVKKMNLKPLFMVGRIAFSTPEEKNL